MRGKRSDRGVKVTSKEGVHRSEHWTSSRTDLGMLILRSETATIARKA
jgi:hypothetical protein